MRRTWRLKAIGYFHSCISVVLLAIPAWSSARYSMVMMLALIAGMVLSILGMIMRWNAHRLTHRF